MRIHRIFILIYFIALLGPGSVSAQSYVFYLDNFYNNALGWPESKTPFYAAMQEDDYYIIQRRTEDAPKVHLKYTPVNTTKEYEIETSILINSAMDMRGYGLVWGAKDDKNYYAFLLSRHSNCFKVIRCENGEPFNLINWTYIKGELSKEEKPFDIFKLKRSTSGISFSINAIQLGNIPDQTWFGSKSGFILNDPGLIAIDYLSMRYQAPVNLVPGLTKGLIKERLGNNINSPHREHDPVITPDGKSMYVVRQHPANINGKEREDIWVSTLQADSTWSPLKNMGRPLNNETHNGVLSATPDNNSLLINGLYRKGMFTNFQSGISLTTRNQSGGWNFPQDVKIKNFFNLSHFIAARLSNNGKVIVFGIERRDGYGDGDLYVSFLQEDGTWTEPKNMGPVVNTAARDSDPFIASDGVTLYYSTAGKPGYGGTDIFVTHRLDDTWTKWSEPQNLGPEINSANDDGGYEIPASGAWAYYSSETTKGDDDVYRFRLPEAAKPKVVAVVSGKIYACKSMQTLATRITYYDIEEGKEIGVATSSPSDGSYKIVLPGGKKYVVRAADADYFYASDTFDLRNLKTYKEYTKDMTLCRSSSPLGIPKEMNERTVNVQQTIPIKSKTVELNIWDDELQDGDTISLNVNGKWVLEKYALTRKKKTIQIELQEKGNYIVMYAHNEGTNPPNTAAVSIVDAGVERRLDLKSTLHASAAINLQYKP